MSRARNLAAWDAVTAELDENGGWSDADSPEREQVARALDELDAASGDRLTSRQIVAIAALLRAALRHQRRPALLALASHPSDQRSSPPDGSA
jgi:hypothetical protein